MELFLQFGFGMKALTVELAKKWNGTTVILSPRDMSPEQLITWARDFKKANIKMYFDPQCYSPKGDDVKQLAKYKYWDYHFSTNLQANDPLTEKIKAIKEYNDIADTEGYILPAVLRDYDDQWEDSFLRQTQKVIDVAHTYMLDKPLYSSLALPKGLLENKEKEIESLLLSLEDLKVDGFYVIAEAPDKKYLIDRPGWISNVLHICASLKLMGKKVIYGYGNHQLLPLSLSRVDAMASGTWLNVRSFTNRFYDVDEQKRRSTWVYYPETLSEYKLSFVDFAYNTGHLDLLRSKNSDYLDEYIEKLFSKGNVIPSQTGFTETDAFKHYLICLKHQISILEKKSFEEAYNSYEMILNTAENETEILESEGIFASQARSFKNFIDINRAAITRLRNAHGFQLKMSWDTI